MDTEQALLQAVIAAPDDDLPRLVMADWYDEHGQPDRAEYIRLSIHADRLEEGCPCRRCCRRWGGTVVWEDGAKCLVTKDMDERLYALRDAHERAWFPKIWASPKVEAFTRRGFIHRLRCTMADWVGGDCWRCAVAAAGAYSVQSGEDGHECPCCHGSGTTPPFGPQLVAQYPLERVELTDRKPADRTAINGRWYWFSWRNSADYAVNRTPAHLPDALFHCLDEAAHNPDIIGIPYESRESAVTALSKACLRWARGQTAVAPDTLRA